MHSHRCSQRSSTAVLGSGRVHSRVVALSIRNTGKKAQELTVSAAVYDGSDPVTLKLAPGKTLRREFDTRKSGAWYDITVSAEGFERRIAGRIENGMDGISDPAMGTDLIQTAP